MGDQCELKAIADVYGHIRMSPLLVGSIKTNLGHTEAAAALTSIAKILIIFQANIIPANLHLVKLNEKYEKFVPKYLKPVTKNTIYEPGYAAVNSFGVGGANAHIILKPYKKVKHDISMSSLSQYIIPLFGRTQENIENQIEFFKNNSDRITNEFLHLYQGISNIGSMNYRSYLNMNDEGISKKNSIEKQNGKRPICFLFPGIYYLFNLFSNEMHMSDIGNEVLWCKRRSILKFFDKINFKIYFMKLSIFM